MNVEDFIWNTLISIGPAKISFSLATVLYLNTLQADFVYDDSRAILKNPDLLPDTPLRDIFQNDFWGTPLVHSGSHKSYRPLCVLTFRLNHYLDGFNPYGYHLMNVLLHAIVTALFVHTIRTLLNTCKTGSRSNSKSKLLQKTINTKTVKYETKNCDNYGIKYRKQCRDYTVECRIDEKDNLANSLSSLHCQKRDSCQRSESNGHYNNEQENRKPYAVNEEAKSCNGSDKSAHSSSNGASLVNMADSPNGRYRNSPTLLRSVDSANNSMTDRWGDTVLVLAGLLFAAHPIHTEAVAGVVGRADVLSCLFFLLAFLSYISYCRIRDSRADRDENRHTNGPVSREYFTSDEKYSMNGTSNGYTVNKLDSGKSEEITLRFRRWRYVYGSCFVLFTTAAMLSKEQGITVVIVCALYDVLISCHVTLNQLRHLYKRRYGHLREGFTLLTFTTVTLLWWRFYVMGVKPPAFSPADNPASDSPYLLTRCLTYLYLPVLNFWLLIYPRWLSFDWSMGSVPLVENFCDFRVVSSIIFYFFGSVLLIRLIAALNVQQNDEYLNGSSKPRCHSNGFVSNIFKNGYHSKNGYSVESKLNCRKNGTASLKLLSIIDSYLSYVGHILIGRNQEKLDFNGEQLVNCNGSPENIQKLNRNSMSNSISNKHVNLSHCFSHNGCSAQTNVDNSSRILLLALSILVFPFVPATNIFFYVGFVVAERILYIPSMGFCLLVAVGQASVLSRLKGKRILRLLNSLVFLFALVAFCWRTVERNKDWVSEEALYRSGINVNPAKALGNLANVLNSQGRYLEAEAAYRQALQHRANMADVHYNLGILLQDQKRYHEAVESYQTAIRCRPKLTMAHLNLGIVYAILGRKEEAEEVYRKCSNLDTSGLKDPRLHEYTKISALYNLGRLLADQDKHEEAITVYRQALAVRPSHYQPQSLLNMLDDIETSSHCLALSRPDLYEFSESYSKLDKLDEAKQCYLEALRFKPDHIPAQITLAKLYHRIGRKRKAEKLFQKALQLNPKEQNIYQHYGQFLAEMGRHQEASDLYLEAARLAPNDFEVIFSTANALRQADRGHLAEEYYRLAVRLQPNMPLPHTNLGAMLHSNGKLEDAERSYLRALQLKPDDEITNINLNKLRSLIKKSRTGKTL